MSLQHKVSCRAANGETFVSSWLSAKVAQDYADAKGRTGRYVAVWIDPPLVDLPPPPGPIEKIKGWLKKQPK